MAISLAVIKLFTTEVINSTTVRAMWFEVENPWIDHYTVYYHPNPAESGGRKRQNNEQSAIFPTGRSFGVIGGLQVEQAYLFSIASVFLINGKIYEGQRTEPAPPG